MPTPQANELKKILINNNIISESRLAGMLGIKVSTFNYQLNHAKKFDTNLYISVKFKLKQLGVILTLNDEEECSMLNAATLDLSATAGLELAELQLKIKDAIDDKQITDDERFELTQKLLDARYNINHHFDEMLRLLNYKE